MGIINEEVQGMPTRHVNMEYRSKEDGNDIEQELRTVMLKNLTPPDYTDCFPEFDFAYSGGQHWLETASMSDIHHLGEEYVTHYYKFSQCADKSAYLKESPIFTDPVIVKLMRYYLRLEGDIPISVRNMQSEFGFVEAAKSGIYAHEVGFVDLLNRKDSRCIFTEQQVN